MRLSIDPASPVPLHAQVSDLLRSMIRRPAYRSGKLLPPETELAMRVGISRNTLRAGMADARDRMIEFAVNHCRTNGFEYAVEIRRGGP